MSPSLVSRRRKRGRPIDCCWRSIYQATAAAGSMRYAIGFHRGRDSARSSKNSWRPSACVCVGFLIFTHDVFAPSVWYGPPAHFPTTPSVSRAQAASNRSRPRPWTCSK